VSSPKPDKDLLSAGKCRGKI